MAVESSPGDISHSVSSARLVSAVAPFVDVRLCSSFMGGHHSDNHGTLVPCDNLKCRDDIMQFDAIEFPQPLSNCKIGDLQWHRFRIVGEAPHCVEIGYNAR